MIDFLRWLGAVSLGFILLMIAACALYIIGFTMWQITKRICEGIKQGMDERERHDR